MRTIAMALVACLTASTLPAAEPPPVPIGARVRARATDGSEVRGILVAYGAGGLTIETRAGRDASTLSFGRIERLQVADGQDWLAGVGGGVLVGVLVGLVVGFAQASRDSCDELCGLAVPAMAILGIPLGALVGAAAAPPHWREVPLPALPKAPKQGLGFQVAPVRGGARLALTYTF